MTDTAQLARDIRTAANAVTCACELLALAEASAVDRIAHISEARQMLPDLLPLAQAIEAEEARRDAALAKVQRRVEQQCGGLRLIEDDEARDARMFVGGIGCPDWEG